MTDLTTPAAETTPAAPATFTPAPAPTTAQEAFTILRAHLPEAEALEVLAYFGARYSEPSEVIFEDAPGVSAVEAVAVMLGRVHYPSSTYYAGRNQEARENAVDLVLEASNRAGLDKTHEETRADYVARCYGSNGDEPGDCWAIVVLRDDGVFVVTDGDDAHRETVPGFYLTLEAAAQAAADHAEDSDEGDGEDAEGVVAAERAAARERANDTGGWAFGFVSPDGSTRAELRFDSRDDAQALVDEWFEGVKAHNPGTNILWGSMTCAAVLFLDSDGEWADDGVEDDEDRYGLGR